MQRRIDLQAIASVPANAPHPVIDNLLVQFLVCSGLARRKQLHRHAKPYRPETCECEITGGSVVTHAVQINGIISFSKLPLNRKRAKDSANRAKNRPVTTCGEFEASVTQRPRRDA